MGKIQEQIQAAVEKFLLESDAELDGNKSAWKRARKLSLEIEALLKTYRGMSTGRIKA